jgi:hypothetical protein
MPSPVGIKSPRLAPKAILDNALKNLTLKANAPGGLFFLQIIGLALDQHLV